MNRLAHSAMALVLAAAASSPLSAQVPAAAPPVDRPLVTTFDADRLRDLPTGDSLFTLIDALQPSIVSDRFTAGGLDTGQPARLGGFLSSWTETLFRVDGVPIVDPSGSGTPLLVPELMLWDRVRIGTGLFERDTSATGLAIDLTPKMPARRWTRQVEGAFSHGGLGGHAPATGAPPIARLDGWDRAAVVASGPLVPDRLGAVVAASWTGASQSSRGERVPVDSRVVSALSHLVFTPNQRDTIRTLGWVQQRHTPLPARAALDVSQASTTDTAGHVQVVWVHGNDAPTPFRAYAGYTGRRRTPKYGSAVSGITERIVDGPVGQLASLANGKVQTWSLGLQGSRARRLLGRTHEFTAGMDATGGRDASAGFFSGTVGELVHESPARIWAFKEHGASLRHSAAFAAYVDDRLTLASTLNIEAGVRVQAAGGAARGAAEDIRWRNVLPHARAQWSPTEWWQLTTFAGYSRSAYRLSLDDLAMGDPGAPTADVYRWTALAGASLPLSARGALVARVSPGTGGNPAFSALDPTLRAPTADEVVLGVDVHPSDRLLLRLTGTVRRERDLLGVVNVGAPTGSAYASFTVSDPGGNVLSPDDDRVLTVYNRLPASFGLDRYLLTNPVQPDASFKGVELTIRFNTAKLLVSGGATAGLAESTAASRGFGPLENDQGVLGELYTNPNAGGLARGRPFTDRAYTGKFAAVYAFPADVRVGVVARYQDGQPFSRLLVFPGLNQGAEAVRAFTSGESRFLYVGTLDARVRKGFAVGGRQMDAFVDAFNLLGLSNSVEEDVTAPPDVRIGTVIQPPRAFHVGLRVTF